MSGNTNKKKILIVNIGCSDNVASSLKIALSCLMGSDFVINLIPGQPLNEDYCFIPLVICKSKKEIERKGFHIPDVFVFEQEVDVDIESNQKAPAYTNHFFWDIEAVKRRLLSLSGSTFKYAISDSTLRDWCVGAFRMQLGMDEYCHGVDFWDYINHPEYLGAQIDNYNQKMDQQLLKELFKNEGKKGGQIADLIKNAQGTKNNIFEAETIEGIRTILENYEKSFVKDLVKQTIMRTSLGGRIHEISEEINKPASDKAPPTEEIKTKINNTITQINKEIVRDYIDHLSPRGTQVRFLKPFGKMNALFIDDHDKNELSFPSDWYDLFNITQCIYNDSEVDKNKDKISWLIGKLKGLQYQKYMIDFILLDLSIKDNRNEDPTGYHFLPVLRQFFPLTPIIVFSSFSDMGHIARAFKEGASWYLRKENKEKLPRHILSIFSKPQWEREWKGMKIRIAPQKDDNNDTNQPPEKEQNKSDRNKATKSKLSPIQEFLIASSLKRIPGQTIQYKKPSEGASSAQTFIVKKDATRAVVKIDSPNNTRSEYDRYQRFIRPYLDNNAGRIYDAPVIANYRFAAISYTFAGSTTNVETFKDYICESLHDPTPTRLHEIFRIIDDLYDNLISKLHAIKIDENALCEGSTPQDTSQAEAMTEDSTNFQHPDYPNLFYMETSSQASAYLAKMPNVNKINEPNISTELISKTNQSGDNIEDNPGTNYVCKGIKKGKNSAHFFVAQDLTAWNLKGDNLETAGMHNISPFIIKIPGAVETKTFAEEKKNLLPFRLKEAFDEEIKKENNHAIMIVHGDLNTGNIMLEKQDDKASKIWLIDFATTHRDCAIIDYTELYYSVLTNLFSVLKKKSKTKKINEDLKIGTKEMNDFMLYSVGLKQFIGGFFSPEWGNTLNILRHISDKVPQHLQKAYQYAVAMDLVYGNRNFEDVWSRKEARRLAKVIYRAAREMNNDSTPSPRVHKS